MEGEGEDGWAERGRGMKGEGGWVGDAGVMDKGAPRKITMIRD